MCLDKIDGERICHLKVTKFLLLHNVLKAKYHVTSQIEEHNHIDMDVSFRIISSLYKNSMSRIPIFYTLQLRCHAPKYYEEIG